MLYSYGNRNLVAVLRDGSICIVNDDGNVVKNLDVTYQDLALEPVVSRETSVMILHTIDHRVIVYYKKYMFDVTSIIQNCLNCNLSEIISIKYLSFKTNTLVVNIFTSNSIYAIGLTPTSTTEAELSSVNENNNIISKSDAYYHIILQPYGLLVQVLKTWDLDSKIVSTWSARSAYSIVLTEDGMLYRCTYAPFSIPKLEFIHSGCPLDVDIFCDPNMIILIIPTNDKCHIYHKWVLALKFNKIHTGNIVIKKVLDPYCFIDDKGLCYTVDYDKKRLIPSDLFNNKQIIFVHKTICANKYVNYYDEKGCLQYAKIAGDITSLNPIESLSGKKIMFHSKNHLATSDGAVYKVDNSKNELSIEPIPFFIENPVGYIDSSLNTKSARFMC